jgi:hypothetical protein
MYVDSDRIHTLQRASTVGTPIDTAIGKRFDMGEHVTHSSHLSSASQSLFPDASRESDCVALVSHRYASVSRSLLMKNGSLLSPNMLERY